MWRRFVASSSSSSRAARRHSVRPSVIRDRSFEIFFTKRKKSKGRVVGYHSQRSEQSLPPEYLSVIENSRRIMYEFGSICMAPVKKHSRQSVTPTVTKTTILKITVLLIVGLSLPSLSSAGHNPNLFTVSNVGTNSLLIRGGGVLPAGYNPFGYKITSLGERYLGYDGSLDSDIGRFLSSVKVKRKSLKDLKSEWVEIVKVSKKGQSMRIYRSLDDLIDFCLKAGFLD